MGIQERKEREKLEMRERIIEAARELFLEEGIEKTSIRSIAKKIEYSPATIYLYFADKDEILYAVHDEAFGLFLQRLRSQRHVADPMERLERLGREYIRFALEHPTYYDLMFIVRSPMDVVMKHQQLMAESPNPEACNPWEKGWESYNTLFATVEQCMAAGQLEAPNPHVATFMIWSYVHGSVSLIIRNRTAVLPEGMAEQLLHAAFGLFYDLLRRHRPS